MFYSNKKWQINLPNPLVMNDIIGAGGETRTLKGTRPGGFLETSNVLQD